jgi:hypothetical protein
MIKRILVPLDPSPYSDTATEIGCLIVKQHDAELMGMIALDIPGSEKSIGQSRCDGCHHCDI